MADETPLDVAHRAMEARRDDAAARLRFHERVLDAELFVLLEAEAEGDTLRPRVFDLDEGRFVLAFDRDDRLAGFLDAPAPYASLAGRRLIAMLAGRGVGMVLNAEVAASQVMLPAATLDWLAQGGGAAETALARVRAVVSPAGAPPALIAALEVKLAAMGGTVTAAWLGTLRLEDGGERLALAVAGPPEAAQAGVAEAIAEAVRFSGLETGGLDVTFVAADGPAGRAFARVGLRFDPPAAHPEGPATGPDRPPILR